jgi:hypothetical protein
MSLTYPYQIASGSNVIPFGSGNQDLGDTSHYFGTLYANRIIQTGSSGGAITGPSTSTFSGISIWGNTGGTVLADSQWAIYTGTNDLNGSLVPTGAAANNTAIRNIGSLALPVNNLYLSPSGISGTNQAAFVWCCWDQANGTPTISGSFNVTSLTDNGVGLTTVNFAESMPNTNYAVGGSTSDAGGTVNMMGTNAYATNNVQMISTNQNVKNDRKINTMFLYERWL